MAPLDNLETITLFTDDLGKSRAFYRSLFAAETVHEDDACTVLRLGGVMLNLLRVENAGGLLEPEGIGRAKLAPRAMFTVIVKDVDSACARVRELGVALLNGPVDRPWGRRTAAFLDPSGHAWEIAQPLPA